MPTSRSCTCLPRGAGRTPQRPSGPTAATCRRRSTGTPAGSSSSVRWTTSARALPAGPDGFQTTHATAERVAELLHDGAKDVVVCSTGLIGPLFSRDRLLGGVDAAFAALDADGGTAAATAIMTTDTVTKQAVVAADG